MAQDLNGYGGAVNGLQFLRGVATAREVVGAAPERPIVEGAQDGNIEPVLQRATEVIGDRRNAMRWLGTPVRALEYATPISLLHDPIGRDQVLSVLTQLEHGVL